MASSELISDARFRLLVESVVDYAIFMLDPQGRIVTWNHGAERLKLYRAEDVIGRSFELFYPPEAVASGWPRQELAHATQLGRFEDEGWRVRQDGTRFWANVVITALRGPDASLVGFAKVTRDLTERRRYEEALRRSEEQSRLLVEAVRDYAILMLDAEGRVLNWNVGAETMTGYAAPEVLGRHFSMFFPEADVAAGLPETELAEARLLGRTERSGNRRRKDGSVLWANVVVTPVHDAQGTLLGYAKVLRDLSEARRLGELEQASQRTQQFLAMLGHELRNPLGPIRNAVELFKAGHVVADVLPVLERQVEQMARVVDDLLDAGRIASGKLALRLEPLDHAALLHEGVEAMRPTAERRQVGLALAPSTAPLPIFGDRTRLSQVLQNLLQNAIKFTAPGGTVQVSATRQGAQVVTEVRDSGIGIAPENLSSIFELFRQAAPGAIDAGLGIGLALAKNVVERHGGTIRAESAGVGHGSRLAFALPLAQPAATPAATPAANPGATPAAASLRVLVVDDNVDAAVTTQLLLEVWGHTVEMAHDGRSALQRAASFAPDLVLMDLHLPDVSGLELVGRLREVAPRDVFVAALTGFGLPTDRENTKRAGFQAHLVKPVATQDLQAVLTMTHREGLHAAARKSV